MCSQGCESIAIIHISNSSSHPQPNSWQSSPHFLFQSIPLFNKLDTCIILPLGPGCFTYLMSSRFFRVTACSGIPSIIRTHSVPFVVHIHPAMWPCTGSIVSTMSDAAVNTSAHTHLLSVSWTVSRHGLAEPCRDWSVNFWGDTVLFPAGSAAGCSTAFPPTMCKVFSFSSSQPKVASLWAFVIYFIEFWKYNSYLNECEVILLIVVWICIANDQW